MATPFWDNACRNKVAMIIELRNSKDTLSNYKGKRDLEECKSSERDILVDIMLPLYPALSPRVVSSCLYIRVACSNRGPLQL